MSQLCFVKPDLFILPNFATHKGTFKLSGPSSFCIWVRLK